MGACPLSRGGTCWVQVKAQNLKGKSFTKKFTGFEARLFQHEYDHLDGVVYIDHLNEEDTEEARPMIDSLIEAHGPGGAL